ncbi:MAG TPA: alanine dehydrogenase [Candidatus Hydrogenedentes bacterium]|nr:alanine dehydrogenase [Candidatus Hydrogenedentota bacterium]
MIVGVPKEIKAGENRVAILPSGVAAFVAHGHEVLIEKGAGLGSGITDAHYRDAGATIMPGAKSVWERAALIVKVKEPVGPELARMRPGQILYTYLHLASDETLTQALLAKKVTAIAYETIQRADGALPLLTPMSEVAGRLSVQKAAQCLEAASGGRGILLSGVSGVKPAHVVILGAGTAGQNACHVAVGMGAHVTILDIDPSRLRYVHDVMGGHVTTLMSNRATVGEEVITADVVIGTVLIPGARAPVLVTKEMVKQMRPGAAIVDVAIDQGGCIETSKPTTHVDPTYIVNGVVHYCVTNMPGAVPRTSTYALTNATLGYGLAIADKGVLRALREDSALRRGLNVYNGVVTHEGVASAFNLPCGDFPDGNG